MHPAHDALLPAGPQAAHLADIWWLFLGVSVVVYVLVIASLAFALVRSRRRAIADADTPRAPGSERTARLVVGTAIAATVLTLAGLLVGDLVIGRAVAQDADDALRIEVTGHQWWWELQYDDAEPQNRVTTANELHIPVGRPVELVLRTQDVIHSFWVPALHGKRDLIPGRVNRQVIVASRAGDFTGQCAEFCGFQHANMKLRVIAEPPQVFAIWLRSQREPAPSPIDAMQTRGRKVFMQSTCIMCHAIRGTDASATVGPDLTHVASRGTLAAGAVPNTRAHLAAWIANPQAAKPGANMPAHALAPDDLLALATYLGSLR